MVLTSANVFLSHAKGVAPETIKSDSAVAAGMPSSFVICSFVACPSTDAVAAGIEIAGVRPPEETTGDVAVTSVTPGTIP